MRVSTFQVFNQNINSLLKKQNSTADLLEQLSTGKKINTAADDPVSAIGIDNLLQQNALMDQFLKNIDYGTNKLALAESKLGLAEDVGANFRENMLQAVNGTLTSDGRKMVAAEMRSSLEELRNLANTKDESGNYIFAGFKTDTQPFVTDNAGNIAYRGDSGERQAAIASGVVLNTNISGDKAFMKAPNALGDYQAAYLTTQAGEFSVEKATIVNAATHVHSTYSFNFINNGFGGINLEIRDAGNVVRSMVNNFDSSNTVSFNGMDVTVTGTPVAGDSFTLSPQSEFSIFDTFNKAVQLLETDDVNAPAGRAELAQILNNTDSALSQLSVARGEAGNHLKSLERYGIRHEDEKVVNGGALSLLEDLDYASAITEFEKQQLALNAVSSVFGKVGSVSLFDYI